MSVKYIKTAWSRMLSVRLWRIRFVVELWDN